MRVISRKFKVTGYSDLRKDDLVHLLISENRKKLNKLLLPSWREQHHNLFYGLGGIFGVILSVVPYDDKHETKFGKLIRQDCDLCHDDPDC